MKTVLIADDNSNNRYFLQKLLEGYGYTTLQAENGAVALELARKSPPNVIISDLLMPVMDGFELCRQWKADTVLKNIPFIVYTATYTEPKDELLALSLGVDKFVIKPQSPEDIIKIINDFCNFETALQSGFYDVKKPLGDEMEVLRQYNEVLFNKLEKKVMLLESETNAHRDAEEKLKKTVEALGRSNKELEQFAYATFHDLQEPLWNLSTFSQLLVKKYSANLNSEAMQYLGMITNESLRMNKLIMGILEYSKIGKTEKHISVVNVNELMSAIIENNAIKIKEKMAVVNYKNLPSLQGDRDELFRLFYNLLDNSIKFVEKGRAPEINITAELKGENWEFCIKDNGIGIPKKYSEKIFDIFQTLNTKMEFEGNGIGLAICKKVVEIHGGKIWVESDEGKGSSFYFTLPAGKKP
jgi:signal transduction histidine kinase